jgi:hypothetical protein
MSIIDTKHYFGMVKNGIEQHYKPGIRKNTQFDIPIKWYYNFDTHG